MNTLNILVVVAHPDEAEEYIGGTLIRLAKMGHNIKILTATNGDVGHLEMDSVQLPLRRKREAREAARIMGISAYEVWDEHDGFLMDTVELRRRMLHRVREWDTDLVITFHDEGPGHGDNRMAAHLLRSIIPLVSLPNSCEGVPALSRTPVVLRMIDAFSTDRHRADSAVAIDSVIDLKLKACAAHATQFLEFAPAQRGLLGEVPDTGSWEDTRSFILKYWPEFMETQPEAIEALERRYGNKATGIKYAETFEIAPYGREISVEELDRFLPL